jgi:tRNA A-37 threonylcarbamoyl transferase component Bud32
MSMIYYTICMALDRKVKKRAVWLKPFMLKADAEDASGAPKSRGAGKPTGRGGAGKENAHNTSEGAGDGGQTTHGGGPGSATLSCCAPIAAACWWCAAAAEASLHRILEDQPGRITCKARLVSGGFAVVKAFEERADRDREAAAYEALRELQEEGCVPRMLAADCAPLVRGGDSRRHAMMISWVGPPSEDGYSWKLPARALSRAREIVARMHALGVVHGDAYPRNIVHDWETEEVFLVDFGAAQTRAELGAEAFEEECAAEMRGMDERAADADALLRARMRALEALEPGGRGGEVGASQPRAKDRWSRAATRLVPGGGRSVAASHARLPR